jgi:hypothetical protein
MTVNRYLKPYIGPETAALFASLSSFADDTIACAAIKSITVTETIAGAVLNLSKAILLALSAPIITEVIANVRQKPFAPQSIGNPKTPITDVPNSNAKIGNKELANNLTAKETASLSGKVT